MGLDEPDVIHDVDAGGGKSLSPSYVSCSICLELVTDDGDRSWAKLQCGHQFHLDCIGSAFNAKGVMQCPNCRKIEKGQWLYATGCRASPEFNLEDWTHDEDLYDLSYSEMSLGVQWCPFTAFSRIPSSFDEPEFPSSGYHDFLGQSTMFAEHPAVASAAHPCPYFAYYGSFHSSSSSSAANVSDGSSFSNHWSGHAGSSEIPTSYGFPSTDPHYHNWEHHLSSSTASRMGNAEQPSVSVAQRSYRSNSDAARSGSFVHPIIISQSPGSRVGSPITSSMIPPYPGSTDRARDRVQALQAYFQQPSSSPPMRAPSSRRSSSHRGLTQLGTPSQSYDHATGGFIVFPSGSSNRNLPEPENPMSRFHGWDRENLASPFSQAERDSSWGGFHQIGGGSSSFCQRHGSERTPSQSRQ